jgi:hypothetical protein
MFKNINNYNVILKINQISICYSLSKCCDWASWHDENSEKHSRSRKIAFAVKVQIISLETK